MRKLIGTASIVYNDKNEPANITFETPISHIDQTVINTLKTVKNSEEELKNAGELILSSVFSNITDIELRDTVKTKIEFELDCKEENGKVIDCKILYYLVETM